MTYRWNDYELKQLRKNYLDLLKHQILVGNSAQQKECLKKIDELTFMIHQTSIQDILPKSYLDKNHYLKKDDYRMFITTDLELQKVILNAAKTLQGFISDEDEPLTKVPLTNKELCELSVEFFEWVNKKYATIAKYITNPVNSFIQIKPDYHQTYFGHTHHFTYPNNKTYIQVNRNKTLEDVLNFNHEMAHGISSFYERTFIPSNELLTELEGVFFELLTLTFLKEKKYFPENLIALVEKNCHLKYIEAFYPYLTLYIASLEYHKTREVTYENAYQKMLEWGFIENLTYEHFLNMMSSNPQENIKYILGYLTSLDLENIYQEDPEKAIHLFQQIRFQKEKDMIEHLRCHDITFMDNGYSLLRDKIKRFK